MPLVSSKKMLLKAQKNRYAIGAFNVENMEMMQAVIAAAMQEAVPIIAGTSSIIVAIGFLVNLLLARFTPLKYIFLTGHWCSSQAEMKSFRESWSQIFAVNRIR